MSSVIRAFNWKVLAQCKPPLPQQGLKGPSVSVSYPNWKSLVGNRRFSSSKAGDHRNGSRPKQLLYMDAANYITKFFPLHLPWNLFKAGQEVKKFCKASEKSDFEVVVFIDRARVTDETRQTWRKRREKEVRNGIRRVPQGASRLVGDMFARAGVDVRYSLEADNDDTLASYADRDKANVLSADRDFLRYKGATFPLFKDYQMRKGRIRLVRQDGERKSSWRDLFDPPLTGVCNPFRSCFEEGTYIRGSPSPLGKLGNVHGSLRPLRAALYSHLDTGSVVEEFPVLVGTECVWDKTSVQPDKTCLELLFHPKEAVKRFAQTRPDNVSDQNWYKHEFAFRCVVAELCCTASGATLLETLEPLLIDVEIPRLEKRKRRDSTSREEGK